MLKLTRHPANPILKPDPTIPWMSAMTMNPGLWFDGKTFHMLFTARGTGDTPMCLGYASSSDGVNFTCRKEPFMVPSREGEGFDTRTVDDARLNRFGDTYYISYNARGQHPYRRVGLATTRDFKAVQRLGPLTAPDISNANVLYFPEKIGGCYHVLHRPSPFQPHTMAIQKNPDFQFQIRIAKTNDFMNWYDDKPLAGCEFEWENQKIGGAGVPVRTSEGWLMLYHGVYFGPDVHIRTYRVGVMLLDLDDPSRVIARCPHFIMQPETDYERFGNHDNVVFPCANPVIGDTLYIYYGAADTACCLATVLLSDLLACALEYKR